jgi:hypothetical protein
MGRRKAAKEEVVETEPATSKKTNVKEHMQRLASLRAKMEKTKQDNLEDVKKEFKKTKATNVVPNVNQQKKAQNLVAKKVIIIFII